jgi:DNA repair exonuclease SbcCD ATPase subunit
MELHEYKQKFIKAKGQKELLEQNLLRIGSRLEEKEKLVNQLQQVRAYVQLVAERTQKKIEFQINNMVTTALIAVFPNPYEFNLKFEKSRNITEAFPTLIKNENKGKPEDMAGGGVLDVVSLALRAARWSLKPSRRVLILDEPGKNLSRNLQSRFAEMLHMISEKLGIQIIISTHIPEIIEKSDRVFETKEGEVTVK